MKKIVLNIKIEADIKKDVLSRIEKLKDKDKFLQNISDDFYTELYESAKDLFNPNEFENIQRDIKIKFE